MIDCDKYNDFYYETAASKYLQQLSATSSSITTALVELFIHSQL